MNKSLVWRIFLLNKFIEIMTGVIWTAGIFSGSILLIQGLEYLVANTQIVLIINFITIIIAAILGIAIWALILFFILQWLKDNWDKAVREARKQEDKKPGPDACNICTMGGVGNNKTCIDCTWNPIYEGSINNFKQEVK